MDNELIAMHADVITNSRHDLLDPGLLLARDGSMEIYYAPFDYVNESAEVVIVGITPGKTQMKAALEEARRQLTLGRTHEEVRKAAKEAAGFAGSLRPNLVALLDKIGLASALGLPSCAELFTTNRSRLHTCSISTFPTFVDGKDYRGTPRPLKSNLLRQQIRSHFVPMVQRLSRASFVPLGPVPTEVLSWLTSEGVLSKSQVLEGLPHPSGANAERISYFLGNKSRGDLSAKTDPVRLDIARESLVRQVQRHFANPALTEIQNRSL